MGRASGGLRFDFSRGQKIFCSWWHQEPLRLQVSHRYSGYRDLFFSEVKAPGTWSCALP